MSENREIVDFEAISWTDNFFIKSGKFHFIVTDQTLVKAQTEKLTPWRWKSDKTSIEAKIEKIEKIADFDSKKSTDKKLNKSLNFLWIGAKQTLETALA